MKLRIQENSLRLRLTQKEVAYLSESGRAESSIRFPTGRTLRYSVESSTFADDVSVLYEGDFIRVQLPKSVATAWAESRQVTIQGPQHLGIQILVEKDFQCLHKPEERDPDAYPNPLAVRQSDGRRSSEQSPSPVASALETADGEPAERWRSAT
jgi:hypothetical protein